MARPPKILKARFEQVLTNIDGPQLVLLAGPAGSKIVGIAVHDAEKQYPYFAAQVSADQFRDYLMERFDLRYLLMRPDFKRHFTFDLADMADGEVPMRRHRFNEAEDEDLLPEAGLFARDHTEHVEMEASAAQVVETFGVDGKWDLPEFSRFYSQVNDLYALFNSVDVFLDQQASIDQRRKVQDAFMKPFEGGGSYVSLYGSLESAHPRFNRLRVESITYNSPGYVQVSGRAKPLAEIREMLTHFERNFPEISAEYKALYRLLSENKLLRMPSSRFNSSMPVAGDIQFRANVLSEALDAVPFSQVLAMAGGNALIAAKVVLSIYRRALRLHEFFLEGRASYDHPSSVK